MKNLLCLLVIIFGGIFGAVAQDLRGSNIGQQKNVYYRYPIELTIGNHAVTAPFRKIFRLKPFHPAVAVGTEITHWRNDPHHVFSPVKLGFFYNKYSTHGLYLTGGIGYRYLFNFGLFADVGAELGYLHTVRPIKKLKFKDGVYKKQTEFGKPSLMMTSFLSVGYDFNPVFQWRWAVFLRYMPFGQTPYNGYRGNFYPQAILSIGLRYQPTWGLGPNCPPGMKGGGGRVPKPKKKKQKAKSGRVVG